MYVLYLLSSPSFPAVFFFNDTATTEIYTLSLHDALPILRLRKHHLRRGRAGQATSGKHLHHVARDGIQLRSEEHTSELQSLRHLVCRLLLEKKKKQKIEENHRVTPRTRTLDSTPPKRRSH